MCTKSLKGAVPSGPAGYVVFDADVYAAATER